MKGRFSSDDVTAVVKNLREEILGLRVANIYDINPKTYLLKLSLPDKKRFLIIESGIRIHTTEFAREKNNIPSVFTLKVALYPCIFKLTQPIITSFLPFIDFITHCSCENIFGQRESKVLNNWDLTVLLSLLLGQEKPRNGSLSNFMLR